MTAHIPSGMLADDLGSRSTSSGHSTCCTGANTAPTPCDDANTFDPAAWIQTLAAIGGGYALASGRKLWLVVDQCPSDELATVMSHVVDRPDRIDAVRTAIERRQNGETL